MLSESDPTTVVSNEEDSFAQDFAIGSSVSALTVAASIIIFKRCSKNDADNFHRVE